MVAVLQLCDSPKTTSVAVAERFCPVTKRFKTDVTLNQPDKAQFREADLYNRQGSFLLFISQESLC